MNPTKYQELASRTECDQEAASRKHYQWDRHGKLQATRLTHAALGISGEAGELCAAIERWINYQQELDRVNLIEELGDLMWYIVLACNTLGVDLGHVMDQNIAKLKKRYPDKFDKEQAKEENRDREVERQVFEAGFEEPIPEIEHNPSGSVRLAKCPKCKTPFSDRKPKYCPECGLNLHDREPMVYSEHENNEE